jgi:hypothetical protein
MTKNNAAPVPEQKVAHAGETEELTTAASAGHKNIHAANRAECEKVISIINRTLPIRATNGKDGKTFYERFIEKVAFGLSDCWYWRGSRNKGGYGCLGNKKAHRVSYDIHYGAIPKGKMVLHKCDLPSCVNPNHLWIGDQSDNMRDMAKKGRGKTNPQYGEDNPMSKLTKQQVAMIIAEYDCGGVLQKDLAQKYDVSKMCISRIK